jgi:TIR domain
MPRLFVSYSRTDEVFARRIATSLSQMGADIWIDLRDIPAGMKWSSAIQQGLDICDAMILIVSPSSMASSNVEDEWQDYRDRGKTIIPVLIQPTELHYQLRRLQYINFAQQPYDLALTQLHAELWRKGIMLNQPPNAVTQPVPRGSYVPPQPSAPSMQRAPAPAPARRGGGRSLLTLGCIGVIVAAIVLGGGAFLLSNPNLLNNGRAGTGTPTATLTPTSPVSQIDTPVPQQQNPTFTVISPSARLRLGPGVSYPEVSGNIFALGGDNYRVLAAARSLDNTEDWYLVQHPLAGDVWVSSVVGDLQPDGVILPAPATIPPTPSPTTIAPTLTSAPQITSTPAPVTYVNTCNLLAAGQVCQLPFDSNGNSRLEITVDAYGGANILIEVYDESGTLLNSGNGRLSTPILPNRRYEVRVSDANGGTGSLTITMVLAQ